MRIWSKIVTASTVGTLLASGVAVAAPVVPGSDFEDKSGSKAKHTGAVVTIPASSLKKGESPFSEVMEITVAPPPPVVEEPVEEEVTRSEVREDVWAPTPSTEALYSVHDLMFQGVIHWGGLKFTYYSERVLPGGGLSIPGRHVSADGYVVDGDGYIALAGSAPMGTVYDTPFGRPGKIYDRGTSGNHLDVYTY